MERYEYPLVVKRVSDEDGGGYAAIALDLPGCLGSGETPEEAVFDLIEATKEWIDEAKRLDRDIPAPGSSFERARQERADLFAMLEKQDEMISAQEALLTQMHAEMSVMRAKISGLNTRLEQSTGMTGFDVTSASIYAIAKKSMENAN